GEVSLWSRATPNKCHPGHCPVSKHEFLSSRLKWCPCPAHKKKGYGKGCYIVNTNQQMLMCLCVMPLVCLSWIIQRNTIKATLQEEEACLRLYGSVYIQEVIRKQQKAYAGCIIIKLDSSAEQGGADDRLLSPAGRLGFPLQICNLQHHLELCPSFPRVFLKFICQIQALRNYVEDTPSTMPDH
ncbi:hypothetical protein H1C71_035802, partial [Ictidomys tridecemlineatus]